MLFYSLPIGYALPYSTPLRYQGLMLYGWSFQV